MTAIAAAAQKAPLVHMIPPERIRPSSSNPRKTFADIEDLAKDLQLRGVLQPVLLRPIAGKPDDYELVFGERRWRAAKVAKLAAVPAFVREIGDQEVLELQLVENAKRTDIHPVEEAEAFRQLHEKHKLSVDEIAVKVGKSKAHVYGRIKLCELAEPVKKAALAGDLPATHALLIARIPSAKLQTEALNEMKDFGGETVSYREAVRIVHDEYMLQLADAQWDKADEKLVPAAGSCVKCPKRTGNQPELFSDVKAKDTCTDPACFKLKKEAFVKLQVEQAKTDGKKVLEAEEAKKYFGHQAGRAGAAMIDLDERDWIDPKHRTWREKLGKKVPTPVLAIDDYAKVHELVPRKEVEKALPKREAPKPRQVSQESQQHDRQKLRSAVVAAAFPLLLEAAKKKATDALRLVVSDSIEMAAAEDVDLLAAALGITGEKPAEREKALEKLIEKANLEQLAAIALGSITVDLASGGMWSSSYGEPFKSACELFKIDLKKLEGAERLKKKAAKKEAKKGKPAIPGAGRCAIPGCPEKGKRVKGSPGLWCTNHGAKLSSSERKSIAERNKRLAAEKK